MEGLAVDSKFLNGHRLLILRLVLDDFAQFASLVPLRAYESILGSEALPPIAPPLCTLAIQGSLAQRIVRSQNIPAIAVVVRGVSAIVAELILNCLDNDAMVRGREIVILHDCLRKVLWADNTSCGSHVREVERESHNDCTIHIPHKCVPDFVMVYIKLETNWNQLFGSVGVLGVEFAWPEKQDN